MSMTNAELAEAIEATAARLAGMGTGRPMYDAVLAHLEELLKEQRRRATAQVVQPVQLQPAPGWAPVVVQPTFVPRPAWEPPWVVTCGPN